jgi:hypothetical protein
LVLLKNEISYTLFIEISIIYNSVILNNFCCFRGKNPWASVLTHPAALNNTLVRKVITRSNPTIRFSIEENIYLFCRLFGHPYILSHSSGKMKVNVAPLSSLLFSPFIIPPCDSMMYLDIYNPRPVPLSDLVMNLVNSFGRTSESIP